MTTLSTIHSGSYQPSATANPFTIELTGQVDANTGYALYLNADTTWYALNQGLITVNSGDGVDLVSGTIVNQASIGATNGVVLRGTGTLINQGDISASSVGVTTGINGTLYVSNASTAVITGGFLAVGAQYSTGTVVNAGTLLGGAFGIYANSGISLTNSGTILGSGDDGIKARQGTIDITNAAGGYIHGYYDGIHLGDASYGTVVNAGTIAHGPSNPNALDASYAGDTIDVVVDPGAMFLGTVAGTATDRLDFAAGTTAGTFAGLGSQYTGFGHIAVDAGATWTAAGSNTLAAGYTLTDSGSLTLTANVYGSGTIDLVGSQARLVVGSGVSVAPTINAYAGTLVVDPGATFAVPITGAAAASLEFASAASAGTFAALQSQYPGFGQIGIDDAATWTASSYSNLYSGQTLTNNGTIAIGSNLLGGFFVKTGAYASNAAGATITGGKWNAVVVDSGGSLVNAGLINSGTFGGAHVYAGAIVTNLASGTIAGSNDGFSGNGGTLVNAGTVLAGSTGDDAVSFASGTAASVVVDPGAVFVGTVDGGNALGSGFTSTLEFASGTAAGTFAALQSQYINFGQISVDAGATWTASNPNTISAGQTLVNDGTVAISAGIFNGIYVLSAAELSNAAGATISGGTYNAVIVDAGGSLVNDGFVSAGKFGGAYVDAGGIVTNLASGTIAGTRWGFSGRGGTLINAGTIAAASITGYAVYFTATLGQTAASVVVDPGAVFMGTVNGGNTIGSGVTSTLEFAAGTAAGTFAGLGSHYVDFGQVSIDSGATWTAAGSNTLASGYTLNDPGLLIVASTLVNDGNITGSTYGVSLNGGATLINSGTLTNTAGSSVHAVVEVKFGTTGGDSVTNATGGVITSGYTDIYQGTGAVTVVNQGSITAGSGYAIYANNGLTLDNSGFIAASGAIGAVNARSGTLYVSNALGGVISGSDVGLVLGSGSGTVINDGTIEGYSTGLLIEAGDTGTVINDGTLAAGPGGYAVAFHHGYAGRLVVDPGAVFIGTIGGANTIGGTAVSTLEFAAGTGTFAGFGTTVFDFADITLDTGANWFLAGSAYGLGGGETISGLTTGSTLELTGTVESNAGLAGGMLTLSGGITLDLPGLAFADVTNDGTNTFITACFASGTRIAGRFGNVPVEALRAGDLVRTTRGELTPVRWMGFRRIDLARHPRKLDVMPVRVHAHAFGDGLPARDLVLSPDHAVYVDGRLIPIRYLINNVSIVQETRAAITYWHVELDQHDIILAEDLPCESYLDTGNRNAFENAPGAVQMTPEFARRTWHQQGCAPIVTDPADPALRALHTTLLARAIRTRRAA
jgi:hypothetical protein